MVEFLQTNYQFKVRQYELHFRINEKGVIFFIKGKNLKVQFPKDEKSKIKEYIPYEVGMRKIRKFQRQQ